MHRMPNPIVIAHHLISTAYGWWLPNDPRGSTSQFIGSDVLADLGSVHFGRKKIQPTGAQIRAFYKEAAPLLRHPLLTFTAEEIRALADAFAEVIAHERYTCYACVFMPDHMHAVIRKHKHQGEEMIDRLQEASRRRLRELGFRGPEHPVWGVGGWKVFLDHPDDIRRTIKYVDDNPAKLRLPRQNWAFVKAYDGWPLHPGHSPNSPYARRLRADT